MNALRITRRLHNLSTSRSISGSTNLIEEETLLHYRASSFYPVHVGQVFRERYQVEVKLGFGGSSTVWLCQDKNDGSYKVLKVSTRSTVEDRETKVLAYLQRYSSSHDGRYCIRRLYDSFKINVPDADVDADAAHHCLVYEPLGMSMLEYVNLQPGNRLSMTAVVWTATYLLTGLDYLHTCGVVHTDLKLDNILTTLPDDEEAILTGLVNAEREDPNPRKIVDGNRTIYSSRAPKYDNDLTYPIICDLGMGRFGQDTYEGLIQPLPYRAPEVILQMKWDSSVDIWNMGVLIWELLFSEHLFGSTTEKDCLGMMIAYLGPPPMEFLQRNLLPSSYFHEHGSWKRNPVQPVALRDRLEGADIESFLDFIGHMLRWAPEERATAAALLKHPWLNPS